MSHKLLTLFHYWLTRAGPATQHPLGAYMRANAENRSRQRHIVVGLTASFLSYAFKGTSGSMQASFALTTDT